MRKHITFANVAASLALVLALSGPATAHIGSVKHLWKKHILTKIAAMGFVSGYEVVEASVEAGPDGADYYDSTSLAIPCPAGKSVLGGGVYVGSVAPEVVVSHSRPSSDRTGWELYIHNGAAYSVSITGYAVCGVTG